MTETWDSIADWYAERLAAGSAPHQAAIAAVAPLGIDFRVGNAQTLDGLAACTFAGVVANLSLNNVEDLDATVAAVRRVLRPEGWLVFTIPHPCFETTHARQATAPDGRPAQLVYGYFDERFWRSENPQGFRRAGNQHRTLATYPRRNLDSGLAGGVCAGQAWFEYPATSVPFSISTP